MFGNSFQDNLLQHLARNQGEANYLVALWIFLHAFSEKKIKKNASSLRNLSQLPPPSKGNQELTRNDVDQLLNTRG